MWQRQCLQFKVSKLESTRAGKAQHEFTIMDARTRSLTHHCSTQVGILQQKTSTCSNTMQALPAIDRKHASVCCKSKQLQQTRAFACCSKIARLQSAHCVLQGDDIY